MSSIEFVETLDGFRGVENHHRHWKITRRFTGWHLEFSDVGDTAPTYAGTHATLGAAKAEASRMTQRLRS